MVRRLLLPLLAAALLAGAAGAASPVHALDPARLPALPTQGVVVQRSHDVLLAGVDGTRLGTLAGFAGPYTGKTPVLEALADADPGAVLLSGPGGRSYLLDVAGSRLRPLVQMQIRLAGGAILVAHAIPQKKPYLPIIMLHVVEQGKDIVAPAQFLRVVAGRLAVSAGSVVDTVTGKRWSIGKTDPALSGGCTPAGVSGTDLIAICSSGKPSAQLRVAVYTISPGGKRTQTGPTMRWLFGARSALLSPDGRYVGVTLEVGCGAPVAAITPTGQGRAGYVANGKPVGSRASVDSNALGWTPEGKLVVQIIFPPTDCEHSPPTGVYAVDPASFARTLVLPVPGNDAVWLWGGAQVPG